MDNGPDPTGSQRKKRGRPPGTKKINTHSENTFQNELTKHYKIRVQNALLKTKGPDDIPSGEENSEKLSSEGKQTEFSLFLRSILQGDHSELARVARELDVAENTIYRWINGSSDHPRQIHLKRLPEVLPGHRAQLINVINQTFGGMLEMPISGPHEVDKELYQQILKLHSTGEDETRFWPISEAIFNYIFLNIVPNHQGIAVTYARLMPPHKDGIHSLRESAMRGSHPWPVHLNNAAYLGNTSLAGTVAVTQRIQIWNSLHDNRMLVEIDEFEQSACAIPIIRGNKISGVLVISSAQADFFDDPAIIQALEECALLLNLALSDHNFYATSTLSLRSMPALKWQREQIGIWETNRIITYALKHAMSRREAELYVQHDMELEFEAEAHVERERRRSADNTTQNLA